jgi:hypothetical protein
MDASVPRRDILSSRTTPCNKEHGSKLGHSRCVCLCRREHSGQHWRPEKYMMPGMAYHIFLGGECGGRKKMASVRSRDSVETPVTARKRLRLRFAILTTDYPQSINMDPSAPVVVDNGTGVRICSPLPSLKRQRLYSSSRSDTLVPTFPSMVSAIIHL